MRISTTITKQYFNMKLDDLNESGYFMEFKEDKPFWKIRLDKFQNEADIVFLVGKEPYRFKVIDIMQVHKDFIPRKYSNAISTEYAYAIKCIRP